MLLEPCCSLFVSLQGEGKHFMDVRPQGKRLQHHQLTPEHNKLTDLKKVDFILWQMRG
ncbi:hypothetical protein PPUJ13061_49390 [Pseudomonas putida]|uniref:Uncharacterized protein n=1 Tax=Pseudomonas putida TaxID=303 RepID=A0A1L7N765_PSEPU|nr:Uncharacterized protein KF715C_ch7370 [Pseudomonas putida]GLO05037.1 hypothetical protein PPUJ13061_49390 [Pseudomonas putida]